MRARAVFAALVVAYAGLLVVGWLTLPARVPMHFGAGGEVDDWASRPAAILAMAGIGAALAALFGGLAGWAERGIPLSWVNVSHKGWWTETAEREARFRAMLAVDFWRLGALTMAFLLAPLAVTIAVADDTAPRLAPWFYVALAVFLVATVGYSLWMSFVRYRPDETGEAGSSA